ncbi:MAG: DUF2723 domain-containing protein [bacterium]
MARSGAIGVAGSVGGSFASPRRPPARGSTELTARRAEWFVGGALLLVYVTTMAPGVTFWDAGEFIAAAHSFGIPHPPGTPLFVALGRVWTLALGGVLGVARASNLLSAVCTALAGVCAVSLVVRDGGRARDVAWGAVAGALCAGLMSSVWANATETEVYAVSLLHVTVMLVCAQRASEEIVGRDERWLLCTAYLIALAPAVHLSALVGAPAAIVMASRSRDSRWCVDRVLLLGGVLVATAGMGRMSFALVGAGTLIGVVSAVLRVRARRTAEDGNAANARTIPTFLTVVVLAAIASSAVFIMLLRAQHDPSVNQGNPSTLSTLADVIARRQYDVAPMWPRRAPIWLQLANLAQYADWQFALAWGRGIFTTPARVVVTAAFLIVGGSGWRAMRRDVPKTAETLAVLTICGTIGVCVYLNLKAGATLGYGFVPGDAHEARERDYFFVLGFWGWGLFAGYGALAFVRSRRWPAWTAITVALAPVLGNWAANDRPRSEGATAPRQVALALLESSPRNAVLFVSGDNDTYPVWYLQFVEGVRSDVTPVTLPLLPADWYADEIARRTGLRWPASEHVDGAKWQHEERAALIARSARLAGRPVVASTGLQSRERALLGSAWRLNGAVYVSSAAADGSNVPPAIDNLSAPSGWQPIGRADARKARLPDDVSTVMLSLLDCPRLARLPAGPSPSRDSLEVRCNFR